LLLQGRDLLLLGRDLLLQSPPYICVRLSLDLLTEHADCTFFVHDLLPQLLQLFLLLLLLLLLLLSLAFHSEEQGVSEV
jgi:hypothetical protein